MTKMNRQGAYALYLDVKRPLKLTVGSLKRISLPPGRYAYIGSARAGIAARILRHRRLAEEKTGKIHWHIDYLLAHPQIQWVGETAFVGENECDVSQRFASRKGVTVPVPRFGSTDCRRRCTAHLYRLGPNSVNT